MLIYVLDLLDGGLGLKLPKPPLNMPLNMEISIIFEYGLCMAGRAVW
jgi:hypothetical protein